MSLFGLGLCTPRCKSKTDYIQRIFWNHSIKKWADITSPFILNDNIICFIAFVDVFSIKKYYQNIANNFRLSDPPPNSPPPDIDGRTFFSKRVSNIQIVQLFVGFSKPLKSSNTALWIMCVYFDVCVHETACCQKKSCFCPLNETEKHMNAIFTDKIM